MDLNKLSSRLKCGELQLARELKLKSSVWQKFGYILEEDKKIEGYVACFSCKRAIQYSGHKTGTSNLLRHKCETGQKSIFSFVSKVEAKKTPVKPELKESVKKKIVNFVAKDIVPFNVCAGKGFIELAQHLIDVGAKHGSVDAVELLPHPTTVSKALTESATFMRDHISSEVKAAFSDIGGAITFDLWCDMYRKINYMGVTAHYIKNGILEERVLCTREFDSDIKKSGENIRRELMKILRSYDIEGELKRIMFVTDRGSNIVAALRPFSRISCSAHILNTVLEHTTRSDENDETAIVEEITKSCRALTTYFKRSGLQNRLQKSLKGDSETRWNSKLGMFESVFSQWEHISEILREKDQTQYLDVSQTHLEEIISFLIPFKTASDELEASKVPTLHLVLLWKHKLLSHLGESLKDSTFIANMKRKAMNVLKEKLDITPTHKLATFLHPKYKGMKFLQEKEREEVRNEARKLMDTFHKAEEKEVEEPPCKKTKKSYGKFEELEDSDEENCTSSLSTRYCDEVDKYMSTKVTASVDFELLSWWQKNEDEFPRLKKVAYFIHSIPASSAPAERSFSTAGRLIQSRRTSLKPSSVDNIIFLNSNLR